MNKILKFKEISRIILDNFKINEVKEAVKIVSKKFLLEISGNINEINIIKYAKTGVDYISIGALTHSDFGGGGTNHKGHQFNLSYPVTKRFSVDVVWFDNKKKMTLDYNKLFLDFKYKL